MKIYLWVAAAAMTVAIIAGCSSPQAVESSSSYAGDLPVLENPEEVNYQTILVEDYESAYARRLLGFDSPTYRWPSSYWNFHTSREYFYAKGYDPRFYNIIVMGDQIWVEPTYITKMFGGWGRSLIK